MITLICIAVSVIAIILANGYHDEFKTFGDLNRQLNVGSYCDQSRPITTNDAQCKCYNGGLLVIFKDGFQCKL